MRNPSSNRWVLICVVCLMGGAGSGFVAGWMARAYRVHNPPQGTKSAYPREQLRDRLIGMTPEQVVQQIGRPDRTDDDDGGWTYYDISYDPISGNVDLVMTIEWGRDGKVRSVSFL